MLPNIGAAVMMAMRKGPPAKYLLATTPVNVPSANAAASGNVAALLSS